MAPADGPPLSLRPFPVADQRPKNLADFIARVNAQQGGFRNVTEDKLHEEVKASESQDGVAEQEDEDMSAAEEEEEETALKDPTLARMEVLKEIDLASNIALLTLDSLSLLLSKHNPTQAGVTLSQQLRELVGIGTMGMDKLHDSNATLAKTQDQETVAMGLTLLETNKSRDSAEEATAFLTKEIEAEGKYWEDVMSVKKEGWSICKVPQERHTLGVKFGFSEAAPEFKNNGLAPMRRGDDGSTQLDVGRLGGVSEALVVTYEKDGKVVGQSTARGATDDTSLGSRVLEARNTIFSQELWYELTRESRSLAAYDVKLDGSRLVYSIDATSKIALELLPLQSCPTSNGSLPENKAAETISMALHILLGYAHRCNELLRIRPIPPHVSRSRQQAYTLLRPIIARMMAVRNITSSTKYIGGLVQALKKAGLSSSFTLRTPQVTPVDPGSRGPNQPSSSLTLVRNMQHPQDFTIEFTILPDMSLTIRGRTFMIPMTATYYNILLPHLGAVTDYLRTAVSRALATHFLGVLCSLYDRDDFIQSVQGNSIRDLDKDALDIRFAIDEEDDSTPSLVLSSATVVDNKPDSKKWKWTAGAGSEARTLDDVETVDLVPVGIDVRPMTQVKAERVEEWAKQYWSLARECLL
ncbi:Mediator of RNA polymerase II transcription subunit 17 [Cladobotryum mycophilum]|uniref:Mediator of RNA polymerase II transcription subunit 17 n=1 Tax=Cladobotryum mycophilum TaxID=491253 RepID=A0ABR0SHF6_9HYPO